MTARAIALVGQPSTLITCVLEGLAGRGYRTSTNPFVMVHHDRHAEVLANLRAGPSPVAVGVWCPYAVSHFDAADVWVLAARAGTGHAARLSDHPAWEKWRGKLDPGEFWASSGEDWIFDVPTVTTKIAEAIAESLG